MRLTFLMLFLITTSSFSQFSSPKEIFNSYSLSSNPVDFDNDGDMDLISFEKNIWLLKNNGFGVFEKIQLTNSWTIEPESIKIGDVNNDGFSDIICRYFSSSINKITCLYNNGNGELLSEVILSNNSQDMSTCQLIDYDSDNDLDIICKSISNSYKVYIIENNITFFDTETRLFSNAFKTFYDINEDGFKDVLLSYGSNSYFKFNDGNGDFIDSTSMFSGFMSKPIFVDLDGDNDIDICDQTGNTLGFYINDGNGQISLNSTTNLLTTSSGDINIKDINNDNLPEILTCSSPYSTTTFSHNYKLNLGGVNFSSEISLNLTGVEKNGYVAIEDFDNNGFIDILTQNLLMSFSTNFLDFENGQRIFNENNEVINFEIADINNDNIEDILYTNYKGVCFKLGQNDSTYSDSSFQIYANSNLFYNNGQLFLKDFNNDGFTDVFFTATPSGSGSNKTFRLLINNQDSTFSSSIIVNNIFFPTNITVSDVDNDNYLDIVFYESYNSTIKFFKNLQNNTFSTSIDLFTTQDIDRFFDFFDMDNDGDNDLVSSNLIGNVSELFFVENTGSIPYTNAITLIDSTIGNNPQFFSYIDLNLDNQKDLTYSSSYYDTLTNQFIDVLNVYLNDSLNSYNLIASKSSSSFYNPKVIDLNKDGFLDFVGLNNGRLIAVFQNDSNLFTDFYGFNEFVSIPGFIHYSFRKINSDLVFKPSANGLYLSKNNFKNNIKIKQFVDLNSNQEFDGFDIPIPNKQSFLTPSNVSYYGNNQGISIASDLTVGLNELISQNVSNFNLTSNSPSFQIIHDNDSIYNCNFAFEPDTIINDFDLNLVGGFPRCSSTINYWLDIENIGTNFPNGVIELNLDSVLVLSSTSITPDSINGNILYWSFDSLNYFESKQIQVSINTPGFLNIGDTMRSFLTVTVFDSLTNSSISYEDSLSQILVCAYDPNDKIVEPSGYSDEGYIKNDTEWLEYTIRFQNTGNDTAINVVILDQLDSYLDWNSLEILSSSDILSASVNNSGIITFAFNNIYLPDSTIDEIGSHGFVNYKIKLNDNLSTGIKIFNGASIYFDYNPPIYTNYTLNTIYDCDDIVQLYFPENSCENTEINGSINIILDTLNTSWKINGVEYSTENEFNWIFDSSGIYSVEVMSNGNLCTIDSMKNITIFQKPSILISPIVNDTICQENLPINLPLVNPNGGLWISPYTSSNSYNPPNSIIGNQFLVYHFVDSNNCANKDSTSVFINQTPHVELIEFQFDTVCQNHFPYLLPNVTPLNGIWNSIDVSGGVFNPTTINIGNQELVYTFIDSNSCKNSDTLKLLIEACLSINELENNIKIYPNPFNDKLYIENIPLDQYEIIIYDIAGNIKYYNTSNNTEENKLINLDFNSGFYFLKITTLNLNKEYIFKIVKI